MSKQKPKMNLVTSSVINAIGWDASDRRSLYVALINGHTYVYRDVERHIYKSFLAAASKGSYFNKAIRGKFICTKVEHGESEMSTEIGKTSVKIGSELLVSIEQTVRAYLAGIRARKQQLVSELGFIDGKLEETKKMLDDITKAITSGASGLSGGENNEPQAKRPVRPCED